MDMNKETLERMRQMRLFGMSSAFKSSLDGYSSDSMTNDQFISWLVANEWDDRCNKVIARLIKNASFRYDASIEEINYTIDRGLDKNQMDRLADLSFVKESRDLFITGCTGTGKSYIATALGYRACQKGFRVFYSNTYKLMGKLKLAKAKGDILKELKRIEKTDVLILEDFCMHPFDAGSRMSLMDIIEDRFGKKTTILTSQVPVKDWYDLIGDKTVADAILDRLVHNALRIELKGDSLRKLLTAK